MPSHTMPAPAIGAGVAIVPPPFPPPWPGLDPSAHTGDATKTAKPAAVHTLRSLDISTLQAPMLQRLPEEPRPNSRQISDGWVLRTADDATIRRGFVQPRLSEAALFQHRLGARHTPAERQIERFRIRRAAGCVDVTQKPVGQSGVEGIAGLLESGEGVG